MNGTPEFCPSGRFTEFQTQPEFKPVNISMIPRNSAEVKRFFCRISNYPYARRHHQSLPIQSPQYRRQPKKRRLFRQAEDGGDSGPRSYGCHSLRIWVRQDGWGAERIFHAKRPHNPSWSPTHLEARSHGWDNARPLLPSTLTPWQL